MDLFEEASPGDNTPEFTVSEITGTVKRVIEGELGWVRIKGEVGRVTQARSGHLYFDLKDERNQLACATWKGQVRGLGLTPEEGMEVVAEGRMTAGFGSKFMLNAQRLSIAGKGALMALLEQRKKQMAAEGLFDPARKKPLPYLPEIIGVVTSPQGAVIRDILHRLRDRFPRKVLVWPVAVQGEKCAPDVARAIAGFNRLSPGGALPRPDLIIVARGGGSIEDLWGFNEEIVARAAAASDIPLISAVGHETDTTLIDFVSDKRAPTPTAAAELAVPVRHELLAGLAAFGGRLTMATSQRLERRGQRLRDLARALPRPDSLLETPRQRFDYASARLGPALIDGVNRRKVRLSDISGALRPSLLQRSLKADNQQLAALSGRLGPALARRVVQDRDRLQGRLARYKPAMLAREITARRSALSDLDARLTSVFKSRLQAQKDQLQALDRLRETLGYKATLARGYAVVRSGDEIVTSRADAERAGALEIEFHDGRLQTGQGSSAAKRPAVQKPAKSTPEQGSLF